MPVSLTCGFHESALVVDPSAAEEPLLSSTVAVILDEAGDLLGA
jgi:exosome complex RNA-binding protein Rrp42 (RNase PH superfamily)